MMIACCNDGTRPVIFKIERLDYKAVKIDGMTCPGCAESIKKALEAIPGVEQAEVRIEKGWAEVFMNQNAPVSDEALLLAVEQFENYSVTGID